MTSTIQHQHQHGFGWMARKRDHKAEYQRRLANAEKRGLSRTQARGHAKAGEKPLGKPSTKDMGKFEAALKLYRQSGNRGAAAKSVGIAPERFSRLLADTVQVSGRGKSLKIIDNRPREMSVITNGERRLIILRDRDEASLNGEHLSAAKAFLASNDDEVLHPFAGLSVVDVKGQAHPLETDPNILHRIAASSEPDFLETYRIVQ